MGLADKINRGRKQAASVTERLAALKKPEARSGTDPLWRGPEKDGVTFSLLSRFLACRERFRLLVVKGLKPADTFNHRLEFGNMWHVCEEGLAKDNGYDVIYQGDILAYAQGLCQRYPQSQEAVNRCYELVKLQFPVYVRYWAQHPDTTTRRPLLAEAEFNVPYTLPSRRVVRLRGKFDSVDLVQHGKGRVLVLQENKTKSEIDPAALQRRLTFDMQTMLYLVALQSLAGCQHEQHPLATHRIGGVRYNVIKRPLSGGKGTIRQHQPTKANPAGESLPCFYTRLRGIIEGDPASYFARWLVTVSDSDIERFKRCCLDPILEALCDWWDYIEIDDVEMARRLGVHWQHPFGIYNPLDEGGSSDLDEYLMSGSEVGLQHTDNLFPELSAK